MVDYINTMITAIFTGLGVAIGTEVHVYLKERRQNILKLRREFGLK